MIYEMLRLVNVLTKERESDLKCRGISCIMYKKDVVDNVQLIMDNDCVRCADGISN